MKNLYLFALLLLLGQTALAQKFTVKGTVVDDRNSALPATTVLVLKPQDSTLVSFASTNAQGIFELKNLNNGPFLLKISFVGFNPVFKRIEAPADGGLVELGTVKLEPASTTLGEVLVKGQQDPVTIKKDTLEFNAGSFKTQPNAAVEELLKKLPGVQVESDGSVTVQGEKVQRVTVDGKEFFGRDPKLATKNLPADAVNKVQVYDKKSDQAEFSGIDDGQRTKTINLELKEEKRNAMFGNTMVGVGTDERLQTKLSLNKFKKGQQLSLLGMANNVNSQGFGIDDYMTFTGGAQQLAAGGGGQMRIEIGGGSSGIPLNTGGRSNGQMQTYGGGLNFNQTLGKNTEANGSVFLNHLNQYVRRTAEREDIVPATETRPNGNFLTDSYGVQDNSNANQRLNLTVDHKIDSANSVKLIAGVSYNKTEAEGVSDRRSFTKEGRTFLSSSNSSTLAEGTALNASFNLLFRHKFNKKGRTLSVNAIANLVENDNQNLLLATNRFANRPDQHLNQERDNQTNTQTYTTTLSATEPLGNRRYLEANYSFRQSMNQVDQEVYDVQESGKVLNNLLTNRYNSSYLFNRLGGNFRLNRDAYSATLGLNLQLTTLNSLIAEKRFEMPGATIKRSYQNVLPVARFNYDFSGNRRIDFNYETSVQEPSVRQLQSVVDNSDPLNIYMGNPGLRPAYNHQFRLNFSMFNPTTFMNFFAFAFMNYTTDAIANAISYDQTVRTTQPVNVKDSRLLSLNLNLGLPLRKYNSRFNVGGALRGNSSINLLNGQANVLDSRMLSGNVRYEYRIDNKFDVSLRTDLSLQTTEYSVGNTPDQEFVNQTYAAEANVYFPGGVHLNTTYDYLVYNNPQFNFRQAIPLLNVALAKQFLKNNSGELRLTAVNLLNRNLGINQTATANYFERETLNSIGQYFMLQFTYNLNKHLNPMGNRGGGIRIMR
ncbi:outer membrane beta-barrel protein [Rufibacter sp. LB8]|uniref:outer membrane beta-barrel protein n=1 Tax=Rufibacter sp. LB8 TaxID=2777781 RepID=UPI00178C6861|nr:outer membrane beta-barrel protein [Rufibacter sp. LB8]